MAASSTTAQSDAVFCSKMLPLVSRTFALSIEALPDALRRPIETAYLMCRIVDSIEDDELVAASRREQLFDAFDAALAQEDGAGRKLEALCRSWLSGGSDSERALCGGSSAVFRAYRKLSAEQRAAIGPRIATMSAGMRQHTRMLDTRDGASKAMFDDVVALERYCYVVAGTVGELLTDLFIAYEAPSDDLAQALRRRAVSFGTGLQLVNILKDAAADFERGVCYLPCDLAQARGLSLVRLLESDQRSAALQVIDALVQRARDHLQQATEYTLLWPASAAAVRRFCAVPLALALATLREISCGEATLVSGNEPKITRAEATDIFRNATLSASSSEELSALLSSLGT